MIATRRYRVEEARPAEVEAELQRLWTENLPLAISARLKYQHLYEEGPHAAQPVLVLRAEHEPGAPIVGCIGVLGRPFAVRGQAATAALFVDLAVDRAHRSLGPALQLVKAARTFAQRSFDLAYGFPNRAAVGVFTRAGFERLGEMSRHVRPLRHGPWLSRLGEVVALPAGLARTLGHPWVARWLGPVLDAGRDALTIRRVRYAARRYALRFEGPGASALGALWQRSLGEYGVVAERSWSQLLWRFGDGAGWRVAVLSRRSAAASVCAYAVIQTNVNRNPGGGSATIAHVRDLFGSCEDSMALLDLLVGALADEGCDALSCSVLGPPGFVRALRERGFWAVPSARPVLWCPGKDGAVGGRAQGAAWYLTDADED